MLSIADNFNKYDIPCDAIHLDIDYMDNFKVFTSNKDRFPDLCHLSNRLYKSGIKLVTIIDPGVKAEEGYHMYDEGIKNNSFAKTEDGKVYHNAVWPGDSVFPDFTSYKTTSPSISKASCSVIFQLYLGSCASVFRNIPHKPLSKLQNPLCSSFSDFDV